MTATIIITCPRCHSEKIVRNGKKSTGQQNYLCKDCGRQFIADHERTYRGSLNWITALIKILMVRGVGVRDIAACLRISIGKVLSTLGKSSYKIIPQQKHYDCLEIDEFWVVLQKVCRPRQTMGARYDIMEICNTT